MSSVLETGALDVVFEASNDSSGLLIKTEPDSSSFITIGELPGEDSAADPGNDVVIGGNEFDFISTGAGDDIIDALSGNDIIDSGSGSDIVRGGFGDDIIDGGTGSDILVGGDGQDIFRFQLEDLEDGAIDRILDFESGVDQFAFGSDIDTDLISLESNLIKYDGETVISAEGVDDSDFELF